MWVDLCDSSGMFILLCNAHPMNMHSAAASDAKQIKMHLAVEKTGFFSIYFIAKLYCTKHSLCMQFHYPITDPQACLMF